jgi:Transposase DNA-binding/Transposase DDE domain
MRYANETGEWASREFGHAEMPDARLRRRLVWIAAVAAARPAGCVTGVFAAGAQRQGAYDFLENERVEGQAVAEATYRATARRASERPYVFVAVDGSSLNLTDHKGDKGFGGVGATEQGAKGLKVISAYAVSPQGVPLGALDQQWWAREPRKKRHKSQTRKLDEKETRYWLRAFEASEAMLGEHGQGCRPWFVADRETDNVHMLERLTTMGALFTVRSSWNRRVEGAEGAGLLLDELRVLVPLHVFELKVAGGPKRTARRARMELRATAVTLVLRDKRTNGKSRVSCSVVETREVGTVPPGEKPLEWRLLTSYPVRSAADAVLVVRSYVQRWKVEEFHKTWKSGACNVERNQLRGVDRVVKWATIMAAVASRIERIKVLSRTEPSLPASTELSEHEIAALILLKRQQKKRNERVPNTMPTLGQATLWLAEVGGYTGKSSGGPPGSITIRRGLERITPVAQVMEMLAQERRDGDPEIR